MLPVVYACTQVGTALPIYIRMYVRVRDLWRLCMHARLVHFCCGCYAFSLPLRCEVMQCVWNGTLIAETEILLLSGSGAGMSGVNLLKYTWPNCCRYVCRYGDNKIASWWGRLRDVGLVFHVFIQGQGVTNIRKSGSTVNCLPTWQFEIYKLWNWGAKVESGKIAHR
jgi:hypothetical protein